MQLKIWDFTVVVGSLEEGGGRSVEDICFVRFWFSGCNSWNSSFLETVICHS